MLTRELLGNIYTTKYRTGSTWLTEQLNAIPYVYISKEIIQGSDVGKFNTTMIEDHLIQALKKPTGKIKVYIILFTLIKLTQMHTFKTNYLIQTA